MNDTNIQILLDNINSRKELMKNSHYWFFHYYLNTYVKHNTADFQKEIFDITEDESIKRSVVVAFRGSAKSTIMTLSYPIWASISNLQKKFIVIVSSTQKQSQIMLDNLRYEFENNKLLINDFGPFYTHKTKWAKDSIVLDRYNTRIMAVSVAESIRGIRHLDTRPDLIILDDVEDLESVKTRDGREKIWNWYTGEVNPLGDTNTKICVIGNMLHDDSLVMKLKNQIEKNNDNESVFKEYPLLDENNECIWTGKYPTVSAINREKNNTTEIAWKREYLLKIVPPEDAVIKPEWIHHYDELPNDTNFRYHVISVDLAISKKNTANYTAMISCKVYRRNKRYEIYILPYPINKRIDFPETVELLSQLNDELIQQNITRKILIETVAYQGAVPQILEQNGIQATAVSIKGSDKRARLEQISPFVKNGQVLFPKKGVDNLLAQITYFGTEKYDDLADAFSQLLIQLSDDLTSRTIDNTHARKVITQMINRNTYGNSDGSAVIRSYDTQYDDETQGYKLTPITW